MPPPTNEEKLLRAASLDRDAVLALLPTVDLSNADADLKLNCLQWLVLAKPSEEQLSVAHRICQQMLQQGRQQGPDGCLYSLSAYGEDAISMAVKNCCQAEGGDLQQRQRLVELLLETDEKLMNRYADESLRVDLFTDAVIWGRKKLLKSLAKKFGWDTNDPQSESYRILAKLRTKEHCSFPQVAAVYDHDHLLRWFNKDSCWHSVPLNLEDADGEIPLSDAAARGSCNAVKYLIQPGNCSIDHQSRLGDTPLMRALKNDRLEVAKILLKADANHSIADFGGNTAVHAALQNPENYVEDTDRLNKDRYSQMLRKLDCAQFNCENLLGHKPLHTCVAEKNWHGLEAAVEFLKQQGALKAALTNSCGVNVLHTFFSLHSGASDIPKLKRILGATNWQRLLKERTRKAQKHGSGSRNGFSCLHFACEFKNTGALAYLTAEAGLRLSDRTAVGQTGIDLLLGYCSFDKVRKLLLNYEKQPGDDKEESKLKELCALVDPVRAACRKKNGSLRCLVRKLQHLCRSEQELSELIRFPTAHLDGFISGRVSLARGSRQYEQKKPLGALLLARCFQADDSTAVADLAATGLLDKMWRSEFWEDFYGECKKENQKTENQTEATAKDLIEFCIKHDKYKVCQELLQCRQFDLVPTCLRVMIRCNKNIDGKETDLSRKKGAQMLRNAAKNILLNALDALDVDASDCSDKGRSRELVGEFIQGRIGTKFKEFDESQGEELSVAQLLERCGAEEVFATGCVKRLVEESWTSPRGPRESRIRCPPIAKFCMNLAAHIAFTVCLGVFITMGESCHSLRAPAGQALYTILVAFGLDFVIIDLLGMINMCGKARRNVVRDFKFWQSLTSFLGPLFLLAGLVAVPVAEIVFPEALYGAHMCLATAYLLMALRLLAFVRWSNFGNIGPTVGIIERLLLWDLLPFLLIFFVFIVAFGVFFQVLLHPSREAFAFANGLPQSQHVGDTIVGIYARPLLLAFGELEIDGLRKCLSGQNCSELKDSDCTCPHSSGARIYLALFAIVFLIINLALLNLLIAKFNLTVNIGVKKAHVTWCAYKYEMLRYFQWLPPGPPPIRWIILIILIILILRCPNKPEPQPSESENYPDFLWLQARKFRGRRRKMLQRAELSDER